MGERRGHQISIRFPVNRKLASSGRVGCRCRNASCPSFHMTFSLSIYFFVTFGSPTDEHTEKGRDSVQPRSQKSSANSPPHSPFFEGIASLPAEGEAPKLLIVVCPPSLPLQAAARAVENKSASGMLRVFRSHFVFRSCLGPLQLHRLVIHLAVSWNFRRPVGFLFLFLRSSLSVHPCFQCCSQSLFFSLDCRY